MQTGERAFRRSSCFYLAETLRKIGQEDAIGFYERFKSMVSAVGRAGGRKRMRLYFGMGITMPFIQSGGFGAVCENSGNGRCF